MALINVFPSNMLTICVESHIYFLRKNNVNSENDGTATFQCIKKIDLNYLELETNQQQHQESNQQKSKKDGTRNQPQQQEHIILCSAQNADFKLLAIGTSSKFLIVLDVATLLLDQFKIDGNQPPKGGLSIRHLPKTPSVVYFSQKCANILLLGDRAGSLYQFEISSGLSEPKELLGHLSMLLDVCISPDDKFILTADRDEKIRVSQNPKAYVIEGFCLGHTSFVNTIACLNESVAVSAGGDSIIYLWDFQVAKCLCTSQKVCEAPIRKLRPIKLQDSIRLVVLPDGDSDVHIFEYKQQQDQEKSFDIISSIGCQQKDELSDFCVDPAMHTIYCLGRNGIYQCQMDQSSTELKLIKIKIENCEDGNDNSSKMLWKDLADFQEKYPLVELYKTVTFGNVENYQKNKEERIQKKQRRTASIDSK